MLFVLVAIDMFSFDLFCCMAWLPTVWFVNDRLYGNPDIIFFIFKKLLIRNTSLTDHTESTDTGENMGTILLRRKKGFTYIKPSKSKSAKHELLPILTCRTRNSATQKISATRNHNTNVYRKVASRSTSRLVARPRIFRLFMKGKFDPYVLWPLDLDLGPLNSRPVYCSRLYGISRL